MIGTIMMMAILLVTTYTASSQPTFPGGIGGGNGVTPTMQWYNTPPFCSQYSSCPTATPYEISRAKCTAGQSGNKCCLSGQQILCTNINPSSATPNAPSLPLPLPGATGAAGLPSLANVASPVVPTFVNGLNNALSTPGAGVTGIIAAIGQGLTNIANGGNGIGNNGNGMTGISLPSLTPLGGVTGAGAGAGLPSWPFELPNTGITGGIPLPSLPIGTGTITPGMGIPSLPSITGVTGAGLPSLPISLPTTGMTGGSGISVPDVPILSLPTGAMAGLPSITGMPDILPNGPIGVTGGTLPSLPLPTDMPSLPFTPSSLSLSRQILTTSSPSPVAPSPIGGPISSPPNDPTIVPSSPSSPSSPPLSPMPVLPELPIDPAVDYFPLPSPSPSPSPSSPSPSNPSSTSPGVPSTISSVSSSRRKLLTIGGVGAVPLVGAPIIPGAGPIGGGVITGAPIQQGPGSVAAAAAATWFGAGPVCANAVCPDGWRFLASARCANGDCCLVGQKVYCQPITGPGKAGGPGLGINTIGTINSPVIAIGGGGGPLGRH